MKTGTLKLISIGLTLILLNLQTAGQDYRFIEGSVTGVSANSGIEKPVTIKVIYDNYLKDKGLKEDWGFSVLLEGLDKEVLFDTGTNPDIFTYDFRKMGLDALKIDLLVISHEHGDHTGGIPAVAEMKNEIPVIIPHSFSEAFIKRVTGLGFKPVLVDKPGKLCEHLYTTGEFDYGIAEQALVIDTKKGLVVMTGCSHPGIVKMLNKIKSDFSKDIYMVLGGFHLLQKPDREMDQIISDMKSLGVVKCGATHCTGEKQIAMFRKAFGDNFFELGVGNTIIIY